MSERPVGAGFEQYENEAKHNIIANLLTAKFGYTVTAQDVFDASTHSQDQYLIWAAAADEYLAELAENRVHRASTTIVEPTIPDQRRTPIPGAQHAIVVDTVDFDPVL